MEKAGAEVVPADAVTPGQRPWRAGRGASRRRDTPNHERSTHMTTTAQAAQAKAIEIGKLVIRATTSAGIGHPTTMLSLAHLAGMLVDRLMRWDLARQNAPGSDRLVLPEGHAVPIIYAAYATSVLPTLTCHLTRQLADGRTASSWRAQ
jgi:hypothetical protein